jgi:hypothetical protein
LRVLLTNHGFTISVYVAVAIATMFAYVFEASQELAATLLVLGILIAVAGRICLLFRFGAQAVTPTTLIQRVSGNESDCGQEICR